MDFLFELHGPIFSLISELSGKFFQFLLICIVFIFLEFRAEILVNICNLISTSTVRRVKKQQKILKPPKCKFICGHLLIDGSFE